MDMELDVAERERYRRHITLPEVGEEGQQRLKAASVLIVGAGGLGSPSALYLAAAGIGRLGMVDSDHVDVTNLHRQILHGTRDLGRSKVDSAADRLRDTNPAVEVETHALMLNSRNALAILKRYDVIIDGADNFPTRYLVNDAAVMLRKPNIYGAIFRFEGQASVFLPGAGPCYRCLYPEPPPAGLVPSCEEGGVLGVLPGIIGLIQATEAIKLILGLGQSLVGRLLLFDALRMSFREVKLRRNPACLVCGDEPTIRELIDYERFCSGKGETEILQDDLSPAELSQRLLAGGVTLIDVREPHEWARGHIEGAIHIPLGRLSSEAAELDASSEIVLYCRSGSRSAQGRSQLRSAGFTRVSHLEGGYLRWVRETG